LVIGGLSTRRRSVVLAISAILGGLAGIRGWESAQAARSQPANGSTGGRSNAARGAFPLTVKPGRRYLQDAAGTPFLIHGDTAWSLIAQLTREEVDQYLDDRRARGFNTILVSLIEHEYSANPPANAYGERPFRNQEIASWVPWGTFADYTTPNEAYFRHADWVLRRAAAKGFLVLLVPSYVGCCSDGWHQAMVANGPERLRHYGKYLGRRYRRFTNILWTHGGDSNEVQDLVRAIAEGIRKQAPRALHTAHSGPGTTALDYWQGEPSLQVNNVYTYGPVYAPALEQYSRPEHMPFFLIETAYENQTYSSDDVATLRHLRTQAYQAMLCGAAGQIFGNNPIWLFASGWQEALGSPGARSMTHLRDLLTGISWWLLEPQTDDRLLADGLGSDQERAVAARTADRALALLYLPSDRGITVDLRQLAGPRVAARWYDPADGSFSGVRGSPFAATGPRRFRPALGNNSSGFDDWVLILESQA
jgi:hypothetical protein